VSFFFHGLFAPKGSETKHDSEDYDAIFEKYSMFCNGRQAPLAG
jgi:hypothetical protein